MTISSLITGTQKEITSTQQESPKTGSMVTGSMVSGREVTSAPDSTTVTKTKGVKRKLDEEQASQEEPSAQKKIALTSQSTSSAGSTTAATTTSPSTPTITLSSILTACSGKISSLSKEETALLIAFLKDATTLTVTKEQFSLELLPVLFQHATKLTALHLPQETGLSKNDLESIKMLPLTTITLSVATNEALSFLETFPLTSLNVRLSPTVAFSSFPKCPLTELTVSGLLTDPVLKAVEIYTNLKKLHLNPKAEDNNLQRFTDAVIASVLNTCTRITDFALSFDTSKNATFTYKMFDLITRELTIESMSTAVDELALETAGPFGYKVTQKLPHVKKITISAKKFPVFSTNALEQQQLIEFGFSALIATLIAYKHLLKDFSELTITAPGFTNETITFDETVARLHMNNVLDMMKTRLAAYNINLDNLANMNFIMKRIFNTAVKAACAYYGLPNPMELGIDLTAIPAYKAQAEKNIPDFASHVTLFRRGC